MDELSGREQSRARKRDRRAAGAQTKRMSSGPAKVFHQIGQQVMARGVAAREAGGVDGAPGPRKERRHAR